MKALEGIRVLACEQFEAGTTGTHPLAFLGAEVIMVETPGKGQPGRYLFPLPKKGLDAFYHIFLNMNKKSITLNLRDPKGVEIFKELVKYSDIVTDNLGPGTMDRLGLGYEDLKAVNPKIIVGTIKGYGHGPYEAYYSADSIAQAMGCSYSLTGYPDKKPITPGPSLGDTGSGMFLFGAVLAALHHREKTGEGSFIEVAMTECSLMYNRANFALKHAERDQMFQGEAAKRTGNTLPGVAPWNIYPAKDTEATENYVVIALREQKQWENLLKVIGKAELIGDERFKDPYSRWQHVEEVDKMIGDWTSTLTAIEAFHTLAQAGVPASVTLNTTQAMHDPNFIAREMAIEIEHPIRGRYMTMGSVPRLSDSPLEYATAPLLGQHNVEVYANVLGYTHADLAPLSQEGII